MTRKSLSCFLQQLSFLSFFIIISQRVHSGEMARDPTSPEKIKTAQGIMAELDKAIRQGNGMALAILEHHKKGKILKWNLKIHIKGRDILYSIENKSGESQIKVLNKADGASIYVYDTPSEKIYQKVDAKKYEPILNTAFYWKDLSGSLYETDYNPTAISAKTLKGMKYLRISAIPNKLFYYTKLTLLHETKSNRPYRIEFYGRNETLEKILEFKYSNQFKLQSLEMTDLESGEISIIRYSKFLEEKILPDLLFQVDNLDK